MPELPEVETVVRKLRPKLLKSVCKKLIIYDQKLSKPPYPLASCKISGVERLSKEILIEFKNTKREFKFYLLIHLRMTGRLLLKPVSKNKNLKIKHYNDEKYFQNKIIRINSDNHSKHIRASFLLNKCILYFYDVRRFGTFKWSKTKPKLEDARVDPIKEKLTSEKLTKLLKSCKKSNLKNFLMKQDKIVGIGNIYASEILFDAGINPKRLAGNLKTVEIKKLARSIYFILTKAIKNNGTTFSDFQHDDAETGSHQNFLRVYNRDSKPCLKCGELIKKITQAQRSTYFCKSCQR